MDNVANDNKNLIVIIVVIITVLLSSTYAFLNFEVVDDSATGEGGCFEVDYTATVIGSSNLVSTEVEPTEPFSRITILKDESCEIYTEADIYIHTNANGTTANISGIQALKYKVVSSGNVLASGVINAIGDLKIVTVPITNDKVYYDIYIWVDSSVSNGAYNQETYSGYIYAESRQSSTVEN